ncbi:related to dihydroorotate dehydrogenase A [Rhynchosporium agropyri]|uniref:Dihydroorotate dehydrogenase (fumarate) n=1 Tax=Rhynchosporium agropyri TaxID=914238 RepID=A0A1E1JYI0_9HELO|nr:related to dihydroorotate dehydrogenase A [Rhynchosporium agropyri]
MISKQPQLSDFISTFSSLPELSISPPLLNSANPWATTEEDLVALYSCPYTGAVTVRTSLFQAFNQHASTHQYTFFSSSLGHATTKINVDGGEGRGEIVPGETSSLNTLGYSPIAFERYILMLVRLSRTPEFHSMTKERDGKLKPFIVSVTGSAEEVGRCCEHLLEVLNEPEKSYPVATEFQSPSSGSGEGLDLMMEINLSCPNIPDKPPPAYDGASLSVYITTVGEAKARVPKTYSRGLHVGVKTPPYTYQGQFQILIDALERSSGLENGCPISFISATNTLGSCVVLDEKNDAALGSVNGSGIGGLAGDALHFIALGNVKTIRGLLDASKYEDVRKIKIIGIGGVRDAAGYKRMMKVGASAVGVGTALGREGVAVFEKIARG